MEVSDDKIVKLEPKTKQAVRISKTEEFIVNETIEEDIEDPSTPTTKKKRRLYVDREKVQYAKELMENRLSNKEMSMLLEISIACVRKLKTKINDGTVEELIDDSEEHYNKVNKPEVEFEIEPDSKSFYSILRVNYKSLDFRHIGSIKCFGLHRAAGCFPFVRY